MRFCFVWKSTQQRIVNTVKNLKFISALQLWGLEWCLVTLLSAGPGAFCLMQTWQKYWLFINCHLFLSSQLGQLIFTTGETAGKCSVLTASELREGSCTCGEGINDTWINCYPTAFCCSQPQLENFSFSSSMTTWTPSAWNDRERDVQEKSQNHRIPEYP